MGDPGRRCAEQDRSQSINDQDKRMMASAFTRLLAGTGGAVWRNRMVAVRLPQSHRPYRGITIDSIQSVLASYWSKCSPFNRLSLCWCLSGISTEVDLTLTCRSPFEYHPISLVLMPKIFHGTFPLPVQWSVRNWYYQPDTHAHHHHRTESPKILRLTHGPTGIRGEWSGCTKSIFFQKI